ncbi:hypothetical protein [Tenacibaculum halocynthiae]|uniref:hypothetical protein n=1 Tax=Tenacibaculum halocynthiae TaxID=1254437 RepID=UPI0038B6558C
MINKITIRSEINVFSVLILIIGGIGAIIIIAGNFIYVGIYEKSFLSLCFSLIFLIAGIYSLYCIFKVDMLEITKSHFKIKSIFGSTKKEISLTSLKAMKEIEKEGGGDVNLKWKELNLYGKDFEYKLTSITYGNYLELKNGISKELKKNKLARIKKNK